MNSLLIHKLSLLTTLRGRNAFVFHPFREFEDGGGYSLLNTDEFLHRERAYFIEVVDDVVSLVELKEQFHQLNLKRIPHSHHASLLAWADEALGLEEVFVF